MNRLRSSSLQGQFQFERYFLARVNLHKPNFCEKLWKENAIRNWLRDVAGCGTVNRCSEPSVIPLGYPGALLGIIGYNDRDSDKLA